MPGAPEEWVETGSEAKVACGAEAHRPGFPYPAALPGSARAANLKTMSPTNEIVSLRVNGDRREVGVPGHYTLLETLRYGLGLTGSKQGCDKGDCGACTVLVDGEPTLSCITPVREAEGREVVTVEGLATAGGLHPLQDEFDLHGAAQCGFCTPGILCSAAALLARSAHPTRDEIREALSGNLCRCTGYTKIYEAVEAAAARIRDHG
jgi:aerobic-type carbon monoxide dehydrogenase small subunit (CoxS/CutS family)